MTPSPSNCTRDAECPGTLVCYTSELSWMPANTSICACSTFWGWTRDSLEDVTCRSNVRGSPTNASYVVTSALGACLFLCCFIVAVYLVIVLTKSTSNPSSFPQQASSDPHAGKKKKRRAVRRFDDAAPTVVTLAQLVVGDALLALNQILLCVTVMNPSLSIKYEVILSEDKDSKLTQAGRFLFVIGTMLLSMACATVSLIWIAIGNSALHQLYWSLKYYTPFLIVFELAYATFLTVFMGMNQVTMAQLVAIPFVFVIAAANAYGAHVMNRALKETPYASRPQVVRTRRTIVLTSVLLCLTLAAACGFGLGYVVPSIAGHGWRESCPVAAPPRWAYSAIAQGVQMSILCGNIVLHAYLYDLYGTPKKKWLASSSGSTPQRPDHRVQQRLSSKDESHTAKKSLDATRETSKDVGSPLPAEAQLAQV